MMTRSLLFFLVRIVGATLLLLLSACSFNSAPEALPPADDLSWEARQNQLLEMTRWQAKGRIGILTAQGNSGAASFNWTQSDGRYQIYLFGPLGMGKVQLSGEPGQVTLAKSRDEVYRATTAEALIQQQVGWTLPVSNLHYWIRGIPSPHSPAQTELDHQQRLQRLEQNGWVITYEAYQHQNGLDLPTKMALVYEQLKVKIVISDWQPIGKLQLPEFSKER